MSKSPDHVLVLGGGVAGIAASVRLAEHGTRVTLLESSRRLGGRASGFEDPVLGEVDRGQHVTMGCCTHHLDLLQRLSVLDRWAFSSRQTWVASPKIRASIEPSRLPPPAHFAPAFAQARFLTLGERLELGLAGIRLLAATPRSNETFEQLLRRTGSGTSLIRKLWVPVAVGACNLPPERLSARVAMHVIKTGFLTSRRASEIGVSELPLHRLYDRVPSILQDAGGEVRLGARVERFDTQGAVLRSGERIEAHRVICALPPRQTLKHVAAEARDSRFDAIERLHSSSIICVHLLFDRNVMDEPHLVLVDRFTHWIFSADDGSRIACVISAADDCLEDGEQTLIDRVMADVRELLPKTHSAELIRGRAIRERHATFAATPQAEQSRPSCDGESGVLLAGDYIDTGWPATMESAARSGYRCAEISLELPEGWLAPASV